MDLEKICTELGIYHKAKSKEEKALKNARESFFKMATEILEEAPLARRVVRIPKDEDENNYLQRHFPGWRLVKSLSDGRIQIEEDPAYKEFIFVNPIDQQIYRRNVVQGQPLLDDEKLKFENPELWRRVTEEGPRVLLPPEEIDSDDLTELSAYFVPASLQLRLDAPRKATEEELEDK